MKKSIAVFLSMIMLFMNVFGVLASDVQTYAGGMTFSVVPEKSMCSIGEEFTVDFKITNNEGLNNFTGNVDFDPSVIQPVESAIPAAGYDYAGNGYITYEMVDFGLFVPVITVKTINSQISLVPSATNNDYEGLNPDGVKTAAELGRVKLAAYITEANNNVLVEATDDGILFKMTFKVVGEGESDITYSSLGFGAAPQSGVQTQLDVAIENAKITVGDAPATEKTTEETTETTTEATTEATTEKTTEATTEETTEATTETTTEVTTTQTTTRETTTEYTTQKVEENEMALYVTPKNGTVVGGVNQYKVGEEFSVDFLVDNNKGINNFTALVEYDPDVIQAVESASPSAGYDYKANGYITYEMLDFGILVPVITVKTVNTQISMVPSAINQDYKDLAPDGVKTASELGRVKLAAYISESVNNVLVETTDNGALFKMNFKVVGEGNTEIKFVNIGMGGTPESGSLKVNHDVTVVNAMVSGVNDIIVETTTQTTTEQTTTEQTTTEQTTTQTTTEETTTQTTTEEVTEYTTQKVEEDEMAFYISPLNGVMINGASEYKLNDEFVVNFEIKNNKGLNNFTGLVEYNPDVIRPVQQDLPATNFDYKANGYITYEMVAFGLFVPVITVRTVNSQIDLVPSSANADYAGLNPDGVKTAGELGRVKLAAYIDEADNNNVLVESTDDGILFTMKFKTVGYGNTEISYKDLGFGGTPQSGQLAQHHNVAIIKSMVVVKEDVVETTTETTTEVSTETTTEVSTETTTETTTEVPTETTTTDGYMRGDVNNDKSVTPLDATAILLHYAGLNPLTEKALEAGEVTGDGVVTASDATMVLLKYLDIITTL